jgi:thiol-disulfide isomerase/thioredoxin
MNMNHTKDEIMSKNNVGQDFEETLKTKAKFVALFYASWCPFSRKFLPIYEKCTANNPNPCIRVMIDDMEDLCEKYSIQFYPTVLVFENGKVIKRLDAEPGAGLSEKQLKNLLNATSR